MPFTRKPGRLNDVIVQVIDELVAMLALRNITVTQLPSECDVEVFFDFEQIRQVVMNLLSNAVKFSKDGDAITWALQSTELAGKAAVLLQMTDEGPGVPDAELESIFLPFAQSSTTQQGDGGTGLGLAICKEIVMAHGGKLWCENRIDVGAIFSMVLPCGLEG